MTLTQYKERSKKNWHDIARELSHIMAAFGSEDRVFDGRLNRLRSGKVKPTHNEVRALLILTNNQCDSYN